LSRPHSAKGLTSVPDAAWETARRRERIVRALLQNPGAYGARSEAVAAAAAELDVTIQYLYRLIKAYEADPRTRSLLPRSPGPPTGIRRLDSRVEAIIEDEIRTRYLDLLKPRKSLLIKGVQARCAQEGLAKPASETINARLAGISKREQVKRRHGAKKARDGFDPIRGSLEAERPLGIVQIDHTPTDVMAVEPDGVLLGNGPGDPAALPDCTAEARELVSRVPVFGICLGHQLLGRALGLETFKLRFGHRGANHPVLERATGRVLVTSQNHGFAVAPSDDKEATHVSLYDGTVEGLDFPQLRARSVQFHPEAGPGPHDAWSIISEWIEGVRLTPAS